MSVHSFQRVQNFEASLKEVWDFFSNPENLAVLTPDYLNLKFTNEQLQKQMYPGQIITYTVKPFFGFPFFWMTEITQVRPMEFFIDEQRSGPFSFWHHQHHFREDGRITEMKDLIHYRLPLGVVGRIGNPLVKNKLSEIFDFRAQKSREIFGGLVES